MHIKFMTFFVDVWDKVLFCSLDWPQTYGNFPASALGMLIL